MVLSSARITAKNDMDVVLDAEAHGCASGSVGERINHHPQSS